MLLPYIYIFVDHVKRFLNRKAYAFQVVPVRDSQPRRRK
jgi:hypothetical protein